MKRSTLIPQCRECMRSYAFGFLREVRPALGGFEHIRGKKKSTRGPLTIPVRLIEDYPEFGAKGSLVPVPPGRMRNVLFPRGVAAYLTLAERTSLRRSQEVSERDYSFGVKMAEEEQDNEVDKLPESIPVYPKRVEVQGITPQRGMELLEIFLPQRLEFHRQVIMETEAAPKAEPVTRPTAGTGIAADLLAMRAEVVQEAERETKSKQPQPIYGSVSTQDVYTAIKARMGQNDEASKVVFDEGAISFEAAEIDADDATKLKHTGSYSYSIRLKGAETAIKRTVKVIAQDV